MHCIVILCIVKKKLDINRFIEIFRKLYIDFIRKRFLAFIKVIKFYSASTRSSYRPVSLFLGAHQYKYRYNNLISIDITKFYNDLCIGQNFAMIHLSRSNARK
jgi:hypothetical protein